MATVKYYDNSVDWGNYVLLVGNNYGNPFGNLVENNIFSTFKDAPKNGYELFSYEVDTTFGDIKDSLQNDSIQDEPSYSKDRACIRFGSTYNRLGKPSKLIIYNHGAGSYISDSSAEIITSPFCNALVADGYCLLEINGYPEKYQDERWNPSWALGTNMGGPIFIRSMAKALAYVSENYNIDCQNVAVLGQSMGGLASLNLCNSGIVNPICIALDAPIIDLFNDAWNSGDWLEGSLKAGTRLIIAMVYGFSNCNFENGTYSIDDGSTFRKFSDKDADSLNILYNKNIEKTIGYNPFITRKFKGDGFDMIFLPSRLKIWHGDKDPVNQIEISRKYIEMGRNAGGRCQMRTVRTSQHVVWLKTTSDSHEDISINYKGISISPYAMEMINYIKQEFAI